MSGEWRKGNCHYCGYLCGFDVLVEDGRAVDMRPDPGRYPYDPRVAARCRRWRMNLTELDGPDRLNHPLRRVGGRGNGRFERVSWDEALDDIAARLSALREEHGGRTLATAIGGPHATYWPLHQFASQFGTPNNMGIGQICWNPRIWMDAVTFGWPTEAELSPATRAVVLWATNPAESDNSLFWTQLKAVHDSGVPLVVVDPRRSATARAADVHLAPRPGTDAVLALSMLHVIIGEDLYDHAFVERWCTGFEGLRDHVAAYPPERAQRECGVAADDIRRAARLYAEAPAGLLLSGRGIDQLGPNTEPTVRALCLLRAVTGNVDRPGACFIQDASSFLPEGAMERPDLLDAAARAQQVNAPHSPLQSYGGFALVNAQAAKHGRLLPERYLTSAHPGLVMRAMRTGDPYPIRALFVMAANPVVTYANTPLVVEALRGLDLCVVSDYYLTPTAQLADYVLPAAGGLERPVCQIHGGVADFAYGGAAALEPLHERRTDYWMLRQLALRLGMGGEWPDESLEQVYDRMFEPAGIDFAGFAGPGIWAPAPTYAKHELPDAQGVPREFATPSGKVELSSSLLAQLGGSAYPEPAPQAVARAQVEEGRVVLVTGARFQPFWASSYFNNPQFRAGHPDPLVKMDPATLDALGLSAGDWVTLSRAGRSVRLRAAAEPMPFGVASAEYGWWFPEEEPGLPGLSGALRSNVNMLTDNAIEDCEPLIGSWTYNGIEVSVERTSE